MGTLSYEEKKKVGKPMMWIGIVSLMMVFAGLTSAIVLRKESEDWITIDLPNMFYLSTIVIIISSITIHLAKIFAKKQKQHQSSLLIGITFVLGVIFFYSQLLGFNQLIEAGVFFTGKNSNISGSFVYVITAVHLTHVLGGLISLLVVFFNNIKGKYLNDKTLGLEISCIYWHFLDILWIYLFLFLMFID